VGAGLAFAGAAVFAVYLLIGRRVRQRLDPITYSAPVYFVCALTLAAITVAVRQPFAPVTLHNLALFLALALVCTLEGQLVYNWSLRYVAAAVVSVSFLPHLIASVTYCFERHDGLVEAFAGVYAALVRKYQEQ
jgi:drug/metabolite transporter (DMT)-like permease